MAPAILNTLNERKQRADLLIEGIKEVARSKENTGGIVKIISAVGGGAMRGSAKKFAQTEVGQACVADPERLLRILQDRDYLQSLPEGTLGRTYYEFVYRENLSADGLVDAVNEGRDAQPTPLDLQPEDIALAARFRDLHDLWHITTGYGRDVMGEMNILFFSYAQIRNPGFAFISIIAAGVAKLTMREIPAYRALMESYINGSTASWLIAEDWEAMMERPVDEVRGRFGISQPKIYKSAAHNAAELEHRIQKLQRRVSTVFA